MASDLDGIIDITISRESTAVAKASFGVIAIFSEFATSKTTPAFDRYRDYNSLSEIAGEI